MENKCFPPHLHLCFIYLFVKCQKRSLILIYYDLKSDACHRNGHLTMTLWLCSISKTKYVFCSEQHQMPWRVWRYPRVIRIRKSKDRQNNGQKKKDKRTNNDLQILHINKRPSNTNTTKNRRWTQVPGKISSSCSTSVTRRVTLVTNPVINHRVCKNQGQVVIGTI